MSCSFYYRQDFPYEFSSEITKIPFYTNFKEYMKDESQIDLTVRAYKENGYKFVGKKIFLANLTMKEILIKAGVCNEHQISIIGSPRFDLIIDKNRKNTSSQKLITLFSFYHASGGVKLKGDNNFFSNDKNDGYYDLFDQVHNAIAQLAVAHQNLQFVIKTKWDGLWHDKIASSIKNISNLDVNKISNLSIIHEENVHKLILNSDVIIAFNSTTVIESKLLNKNVIIPIFSEAKDKYYKKNLLYKKYLNSLTTASSKKDLMEKIIKYKDINETQPISKSLLIDFIGFNDCFSSNRLVKIVLDETL